MLMSSYLEKGSSLSIRKEKAPESLRAYLNPPYPRPSFFLLLLCPRLIFFSSSSLDDCSTTFLTRSQVLTQFPSGCHDHEGGNQSTFSSVRLTELSTGSSSRFYITLKSGFSANGMNFKIMKHECRSISWPPVRQTSQTSPPKKTQRWARFCFLNMKIVFLPFQLANGKLSG